MQELVEIESYGVMSMKCELCKREINGTKHLALAFIPLKVIPYCPHILGKHLVLCDECICSYHAQYMNMNMKEIEDYNKWIGEVK